MKEAVVDIISVDGKEVKCPHCDSKRVRIERKRFGIKTFCKACGTEIKI